MGALDGPPVPSDARGAPLPPRCPWRFARVQGGAWRRGAVQIGVVLILAGCAGRQAPDAAYQSSKGYHLTLPGPDWQSTSDGRADIELRHREAPAGMLVHASCDARLAGQPVDALRRAILAGFSGRDVQVQETTTVAGRESAHVVADGWTTRPEDRVRVELFVVRGDRCVYDLAYVAPPDDFARWRPEFQRLVASFAPE